MALQDFNARLATGEDRSLADWAGKVVLLVNVASRCGLTPQYQGLQQLQERFGARGFSVLAFPCNQFGQQEPGTEAQILEFCQTRYQVNFPVFAKIDVNGPQRHPLYTLLAGSDSPFPGDIKWNFTKFLVGRDGTILKRFDSKTTPNSPEVITAIEAALAAK